MRRPSSDSNDRVSPIAIEDLPTPSERRDGPRTPSMLIGVASVLAAAALLLLGVAAWPEASPSTLEEASPTPPTIIAPVEAPTEPLEDLLPTSGRTLRILGTDGETVATLDWRPEFVLPERAEHGIRVDGRVVRGSFNSDGSLLALAFCGTDECEVHLGTGLGVEPTPTPLVTSSATWHASDPTRIAWVARGPQGASSLLTAEVSPIDGRILRVNELPSSGDEQRITRWDDSGIILDTGTVARGVDSSGTLIWEKSGAIIDTSSETATVALGGGRWVLVDLATGTELYASEPNEGPAFVEDTPGGEIIGRITGFGYGYSLALTGSGVDKPRTITFERRGLPAGFTDDGAFFMLRSRDRTSLTFIEIASGRSYDVDLPDGFASVVADTV